jgi:RNA recognition motif-containing protein
MSYPVNVSQLASVSSEKSLSEFFSFCGKIRSISYDSNAHTAVVTFEKQQAASTALMLNGGTLDGATISVHSDSVSEEHTDGHAPPYGAPGTTGATEETHGYEQHDKPRAGIVAELLAKGYVLSEQILHKAIEVDQKQGISTRFLNYMKGLDTTLGQKIGGPETTVSGKAKEVVAQGHAQAKSIDEQHGITKQAGDYYSRAISSPFGQKVYAFYTNAQKQVVDVHEEALRIAALEKEKAAGQGGYATEHTGIPETTTASPYAGGAPSTTVPGTTY